MNSVKRLAVAAIAIIAVIVLVVALTMYPTSTRPTVDTGSKTTQSTLGHNEASGSSYTLIKDGFNLTARPNIVSVHFAGDVYLTISLKNLGNNSQLVDPIVSFDVKDQNGVKVYGIAIPVYRNESGRVFGVGEQWTSGVGLHWKAIEDPIIQVRVEPGQYYISVYSVMHTKSGAESRISLEEIPVIVHG
ncbi:MAG: hypothetical protein M1503_04270 [Thaumarchaeota archaeon]|nr:hypothetical protein [Nitrososphaerota archaeon]MCL5317468.1 hypothetical protein [Nitrososphaerota archaeon]